MIRLFLIGYMGSGKTSVGMVLAKKLGLSFIDLDQFIEKRYNKTIAQLFAQRGEEGFRKIESAVLNELVDFEDVVISTGGGAPCFFDNMQRMNATGITVYLKTSAEILSKRLVVSKHTRPLISHTSAQSLPEVVQEGLNRRAVFYEQAQVIFDVDKMEIDTDVEQAAQELEAVLKNRIEYET